MIDNIQQIREKLVSKLDKLVQSTEQIYLDLGRDFPLLLNELDESIERSTSSTESLIDGIRSSDAIDHIIIEGDRIIDNFNNAFTSMYSRDSELFEIIRRGVTEMGTLAEVINNIKESSIEMELISLNAMTVALKTGSDGKALSFITDELKKLSAQTIRLTEELTKNGNHQLKLFKDFGNKIEKARTEQDELTENMDHHLKSSFTTSCEGLQESSDIMRSLSRSSADVKEPLIRIMQEVQLQDIIRQSIDHIYLSIEEFKTIDDSWSDAERLDELSFRNMMPDLCFSVLKEVSSGIVESSHIFEEKSQLIRSILDSLEHKRNKIVETALSSSTENQLSIIGIKEESKERISSLIKDVNASVKQRLEISQDSLNLLKEITTLKRQFVSFEPIITRFHNIIVASRIEVAKQAALSDMKDTVTKMTLLTENIDSDISNALETIKHFLKTTEGTISTYSSTIKREMPGLKELLVRTSENQVKLSDLSDSVMDNLRDFQIFTRDFFTLYTKTDDNRKKLNELPIKIDEIKSVLHSIKETSETEILKMQEYSNTDNWKIQNKRLNGIIEKFTIFTHKKTASDLVGSNVEKEEIAESGEVTLF